MEVGGQRHAPAALPTGKRPGTQCTEGLGGHQDRSGLVQKISPPPGFDPRTIQPVESRYTDCIIPIHIFYSGTLAKCSSGHRDYFPKTRVPHHSTFPIMLIAHTQVRLCAFQA